MQYRIEIRGLSPIIMHNGASGLDTRSEVNIEKSAIARKRGSNRTEADELRLRELETLSSLYLNDRGAPTIPEAVIRAAIENGARKLKQGAQVREGLIVTGIEKFIYDAKKLGTTAAQLAKTVQFTAGVVVQRARILRTRAKFDAWGLVFIVEVDDELVDKEQLASWLDLAGRRVGMGDWRPAHSGHYGRFETVSIKVKRK